MSVCTFYCSLSAHPFRQQRLGGVKQEDGVDMREKVKGSRRRGSLWVRNKGVAQSIETIQRGVWKFFPQPVVLLTIFRRLRASWWMVGWIVAIAWTEKQKLTVPCIGTKRGCYHQRKPQRRVAILSTIWCGTTNTDSWRRSWPRRDRWDGDPALFPHTRARLLFICQIC